MSDRLRGRRVTGSVDVYHTAWMKHPWRIWLAIGCLCLGTSFASEGGIVWRLIGCVCLIWAPLLIVDHTLSALQQMADGMYREMDERLDEMLGILRQQARAERASGAARSEVTGSEEPTEVLDPLDNNTPPPPA